MNCTISVDLKNEISLIPKQIVQICELEETDSSQKKLLNINEDKLNCLTILVE